MKMVSRDELVEKIKSTGGKFFSVTFIKRTTGSKRRMICRNGVKKGVTGEGRKFNPANHDLIPTFSIDSDGHRNISIEGILEAKIGGEHYVVAQKI